MRDVALAGLPPNAHVQDLPSSLVERVDERRIRIGADPSKIAMMEELLQSPIDPVLTLTREQPKVLRRRDQPVLMCGSKEFDISVLKGQWREVGVLRANETRQTTTKQRSLSGGGTYRNRLCR